MFLIQEVKTAEPVFQESVAICKTEWKFTTKRMCQFPRAKILISKVNNVLTQNRNLITRRKTYQNEYMAPLWRRLASKEESLFRAKQHLAPKYQGKSKY